MQMLIKTTEGLREAKTDLLKSIDPREIAKFLQGNCKTMGFTIQFAGNSKTGEVVEVFKKGRLCQRDLKPLIAEGFDTWAFSWAFAGKQFKWESGEIVAVSKTIDYTTIKDVAAWKGVLR